MTERKIALITGASSGIGYATALAFARRGILVAGTARRIDRLQTLEREITDFGGEFLPIAADVREAQALADAVRSTVERFGRLDILVANAGIGHRGAIVDAQWDELDALLRTNIDGVLHSVRAAVPEMRKIGGGHIVIVSSVVYNMVSPYAAAYAASKAFVSSLARSLRFELADDNIFVTDMLVGRTESEFDTNRLGKGGRSSSGIPVMPVEKVANGIVRVVLDRPRHRVALRWFDRLLMTANIFVPDIVGRMALRQYR